MKIIRKQPEKYGLQKISNKCHRIVKVLKEYDDEQQAIFDLTRLLVGEMSESDLQPPSFESGFEEGLSNNKILIMQSGLKQLRDNLLMAIGADKDQLDKAVRKSVEEIDEILKEE